MIALSSIETGGNNKLFNLVLPKFSSKYFTQVYCHQFKLWRKKTEK